MQQSPGKEEEKVATVEAFLPFRHQRRSAALSSHLVCTPKRLKSKTTLKHSIPEETKKHSPVDFLYFQFSGMGNFTKGRAIFYSLDFICTRDQGHNLKCGRNTRRNYLANYVQINQLHSQNS